MRKGRRFTLTCQFCGAEYQGWRADSKYCSFRCYKTKGGISRAARLAAKRAKSAARIVDLTGRRFGRLVVTGKSKTEKYNGAWAWVCQCDCGNKTLAHYSILTRGDKHSCGCLRRAYSAARAKHGHAAGSSGTKIYAVWRSMRDRCTNPRHHAWEHYGGRGIKVCERWREFPNFLADMGLPPPGLSLDRINNDGDYEPGNCRWATWKEQNNNQQKNYRRAA